jgi:hypothetical protein
LNELLEAFGVVKDSDREDEADDWISGQVDLELFVKFKQDTMDDRPSKKISTCLVAKLCFKWG